MNVTVKAGSLDNTGWLRPVSHIGMASAQCWLTIPDDDLTYTHQPENDAALEAAWAAQFGR